MSEADNMQPVATSEVTAQPVTTPAVDARNNGDDLEALLKDFDAATPKPATANPTPEPGPELDLKSLASKVENIDGFMREQNAQSFKRDMKTTVDEVRGDLDPSIFDDKIVQAWIDVQAQEDDRLSQAWQNRHADPKKFNAVKAALGKKLANQFAKMPDARATEDRATVAAAVRGASTRAPEAKAPNFSVMSDNDFQAEKDKMFGRT